MFEVQLWVYSPGGTEPTILPWPLRVEFGLALSDVSSMSITYPIDAPGALMLDSYCDVEVRIWDGTDWVCPDNGRFLVLDKQTDPVLESSVPTRTYVLPSWGWLLTGVLQGKITGLDDSGNRKFPGMTPAQVVETLVTEGHNNGFTLAFSVNNQSLQQSLVPPSYEPGKDVLAILNEARDQGYYEWLIKPDNTGCGRQLTLLDTAGIDRSVGDDPVVLRTGLDLTQAPSKVSMRDLASAVLVAGDAGRYIELTNPGADIPYGIMQAYVSAAGLEDQGALQTVAQARLDMGKTFRAELTRQIRFENAQWLPLLDYQLGDTILVPDETGQLASLRVRQITLTFDAGVWSGNLVLGDRFSEHTVAMDRKIRQLTANSTWGGGRKPSPVFDGSDISPGTVPSSAVEVGFLNAFTITADYVKAGAIDGQTITGVQIRTAAVGARVEISGSAYAGVPAVALYDSSGGSAGIYSSASGRITIGTTSEYLAVNPSTGATAMYVNGISQMTWHPTGVHSTTIETQTSTSGDAVHVLTGGRLVNGSSLSKYKLFQRSVDADYSILDLDGKTWFDRDEYEESPETALRVAGHVAEELEALENFEPLLSRSLDGELRGIRYDRISAYTIPVMRDMNTRLEAVEAQLQSLLEVQGE